MPAQCQTCSKPPCGAIQTGHSVCEYEKEAQDARPDLCHGHKEETCDDSKPLFSITHHEAGFHGICDESMPCHKEGRCDGTGKVSLGAHSIGPVGPDGHEVFEMEYGPCPGCPNCRDKEAAKCEKCESYPLYLVENGITRQIPCADCPAHGAAKGEEESEVSKYDGNKRCYFGVWLFDKATELAVASEEKFSEQKKGSVIAAYIEQEADAVLKEVDALLALTRSRSEKVGEARRTGEILNWLKQALWEEEFSKVEMVINGHLKSAAKDDGHQVG